METSSANQGKLELEFKIFKSHEISQGGDSQDRLLCPRTFRFPGNADVSLVVKLPMPRGRRLSCCVVSHKAVADPLMDQRVVGVVIIEMAAMVAWPPHPQLLDVLWCSESLVELLV